MFFLITRSILFFSIPEQFSYIIDLIYRKLLTQEKSRLLGEKKKYPKLHESYFFLYCYDKYALKKQITIFFLEISRGDLAQKNPFSKILLRRIFQKGITMSMIWICTFCDFGKPSENIFWTFWPKYEFSQIWVSKQWLQVTGVMHINHLVTLFAHYHNEHLVKI